MNKKESGMLKRKLLEELIHELGLDQIEIHSKIGGIDLYLRTGCQDIKKRIFKRHEQSLVEFLVKATFQ